MTPAKGFDVSEHQAQTPPLAGLGFLIVRATIGYRLDTRAPQHSSAAQAAGLALGFYHALLDHNPPNGSDTSPPLVFDGAQQARAFAQICTHIPDNEMFPGVPAFWVDVEADGLTAAKLMLFLQQWQRLRPLARIGIYTSQSKWKELIGPGRFEFAVFPLWDADYSGPLDLPDIWPSAAIRQTSGTGHVTGYPGDLDLDQLEEQAAPPPGAPPGETPAGAKLGVGQVANARALDYAMLAHAKGADLAALFGMDNPGLARDAQALGLRLRFTRIVQDATDAAPGMDQSPTDDTLRAMAAAQLAPYLHLSQAERSAATHILLWNEPRPNTAAGYCKLTRLMHFSADACETEGFRLLAYAFNAGTPEPDEALIMFAYETNGETINPRLRRGGHGISLHAGVLGQPNVPDSVSDRMDDSILGTTLTNPHTGYSVQLPRADALVLRHRLLMWAADQHHQQLAPLHITEFYPALKAISAYTVAEILRRYAWLDDQLSQDPEVVSVCLYAVGSAGRSLARPGGLLRVSQRPAECSPRRYAHGRSHSLAHRGPHAQHAGRSPRHHQRPHAALTAARAALVAGSAAARLPGHCRAEQSNRVPAHGRQSHRAGSANDGHHL